MYAYVTEGKKVTGHNSSFNDYFKCVNTYLNLFYKIKKTKTPF